MKWSEQKFHEGMPFQESVEPRGYTIISHIYLDQRVFTATYDSKALRGTPSVGRIPTPENDPAKRKAAVHELRRLCQEHYEKLTLAN